MVQKCSMSVTHLQRHRRLQICLGAQRLREVRRARVERCARVSAGHSHQVAGAEWGAVTQVLSRR